MIPPPDDPTEARLRARFQSLRASDAMQVPTFTQVLRRAVPPARARRGSPSAWGTGVRAAARRVSSGWGWVLAGAGATALATVAVWFLAAPPGADQIADGSATEPAPRVVRVESGPAWDAETWTTPSDVLLADAAVAEARWATATLAQEISQLLQP